MRGKMKIFDYDKVNDILYLTFGNTDNSFGEEDPDNIIILKDLETEEITGVTVLNLKKMMKGED